MLKTKNATFLTALAVLTMAASANAQRGAMSPSKLEALSHPGIAEFDGTVLSEDFESGFIVGGGSPQNDWTSSFDANFDFASPGIDGISWQHTSDGSGFADNGFGPMIAAPLNERFEFDVSITGDSTYGFSPVNSVEGFINTRLLFEPDGTIDALQVVGGAGLSSKTSVHSRQAFRFPWASASQATVP